jgi:hypothetical protein
MLGLMRFAAQKRILRRIILFTSNGLIADIFPYSPIPLLPIPYSLSSLNRLQPQFPHNP